MIPYGLLYRLGFTPWERRDVADNHLAHRDLLVVRLDPFLLILTLVLFDQLRVKDRIAVLRVEHLNFTQCRIVPVDENAPSATDEHPVEHVPTHTTHVELALDVVVEQLVPYLS